MLHLSPAAAPRRGRPPGRHAGELRSRLLASARRLFAQHGFEAVSVADITADAGATAAALYLHFANKRALYEEILAPVGPESILLALRNIPEKTCSNPVLFLRTLTRSAINTWSSSDARTIMTLFTRELLRDMSTAQSIFESIRSVISELTPYFRQWRQTGRLRHDLDDATLVWELFSPLIYVRFAYFQASADTEHVAAGVRIAQRHVEHFIDTHVQDVPGKRG
jgi:AcrR family transcriptional regulator